MEMEWVQDEFLTGFQMLALLGLEGAPATEVLPMTVQVWLKAVCRNRVFDQSEDTPRIREAFAMLAERSTRWPTPADFLASLPTNVVPFQRLPKLESEKRREAGLRALGDIAKKLNLKQASGDEPPEAA